MIGELTLLGRHGIGNCFRQFDDVQDYVPNVEFFEAELLDDLVVVHRFVTSTPLPGDEPMNHPGIVPLSS